MDLDEAVGELYALGPEDFTARRAELAAAAKQSGDRTLATKIGKLRRPTIAAWLVNLVVRQRSPELTELQSLAAELRAAHRELDGARIRELSSTRQSVLQAIIEAASAVSDRTVGEAALQQVRETFEAAIADEGAEAATLSGQLTTALSYSGFGEVDLTEATALPVPRRHLRVLDKPSAEPATGKPAGTDRASAAIAAAAAAVAEAEQAAAEWAHEAMTASSGFDRAQREHDEATARIEHLEDELAAARSTAREAELALRARRREHDNAEQRLDQARRKVHENQARLDRLQQQPQRLPKAKPKT